MGQNRKFGLLQECYFSDRLEKIELLRIIAGGKMATDDNVSKLLKKSIEASNRTTYAIRALVRFIFIQLTFLTAAFFVWQIEQQFPDPDKCGQFVCEPREFVVFLVAGLIITGVVLSSRAGWYELSLSEVPGKSTKPESPLSGSAGKPAGDGKSLRDWLKE
jgi:hypothetical protein